MYAGMVQQLLKELQPHKCATSARAGTDGQRKPHSSTAAWLILIKKKKAGMETCWIIVMKDEPLLNLNLRLNLKPQTTHYKLLFPYFCPTFKLY